MFIETLKMFLLIKISVTMDVMFMEMLSIKRYISHNGIINDNELVLWSGHSINETFYD